MDDELLPVGQPPVEPDDRPQRLPDFIIIGAAKSGTTSLYEYLVRHPRVFMTTPKEPEFFGREERYAQGLKWYASLFADAANEQICGEASTVYTRLPHAGDVPARMHAVVPNVKLIYIVRNPVDRAFSDYMQRVKTARHLEESDSWDRILMTPDERWIYDRILEGEEARRSGGEGGRFEDLLENADRLLDTGRYMHQIEQYLNHFDAGQLIVLFLDDLRDTPEQVLQRIMDHLGIDRNVDLLVRGTVATNTRAEHYETQARNELSGRLAKFSAVRAAKRVLPRRLRRSILGSLLALPIGKRARGAVKAPPLRPETKAFLLDYYRESNEALGEFVGRDLTGWNS